MAMSTRWGLFTSEDKNHIRKQFQDRWKMLHTHFHAAAYMLHPSYWHDTNAMEDEELYNGVMAVIKKLLPDEVEQRKAKAQLTAFRLALLYYFQNLVALIFYILLQREGWDVGRKGCRRLCSRVHGP